MMVKGAARQKVAHQVYDNEKFHWFHLKPLKQKAPTKGSLTRWFKKKQKTPHHTKPDNLF